MNPAEPSERNRVAKPSPDNERGWLGLVFELQPFPILVIDGETSRVIFGNEASRRLSLDHSSNVADFSGHFATDLDGNRWTDVGIYQHLMQVAAGPDGADITWEMPQRRYRFRVYCLALPPADGLAPLVVLTFLDRTQQYETEAELRRALEVRDEFFSIATHELKDPLFSLQLSHQLLRHTATRQAAVPPPYVAQHLEVGQRQIERLSRLIDNLLDVSRIMNRRLHLDLEALDLAELTRDVLGQFLERTQAAGTPVSVESDGPVIGYFDRLKLDQVVSNLLSNALKYGAGRPVVIRVDTRGDAAVLQVEDQGPGIRPEDQSRIFERFERASDGHKKASLGLGLYIVRSLVEAHAGTIHVLSEPGRGATFEVMLPRNRLPNATDQPSWSDAPDANQE